MKPGISKNADRKILYCCKWVMNDLIKILDLL